MQEGVSITNYFNIKFKLILLLRKRNTTSSKEKTLVFFIVIFPWSTDFLKIVFEFEIVGLTKKEYQVAWEKDTSYGTVLSKRGVANLWFLVKKSSTGM